MKETHTFLMPDYYTDFSCKMGNCRAACCEGWQISISMQNYFILLGLDCPPELRHRIDCGVRVLDHPTEDEYARFEPRYDGNCPLRLPDGRCSLHAELGEDILPDVCRLYPRGIRVEYGTYECSCANSCEAVLELLIRKKGPLTFTKKELTVQLPPETERENHFEVLGLENDIRMYLISVIQARSMPLFERLLCLGNVLNGIEAATAAYNKDNLLALIKLAPEEHRINIDKAMQGELEFGLKIASEMLKIIDEKSISIRKYGEAARTYFGTVTDAKEKYLIAKGHFEKNFPEWESFFENVLVNHMFFSVFPFQDRPESLHSEHVALCAVYSLMRFLSLGVMADKTDTETLIDVIASAFRLIDHTEFDRLASAILKRLNCTSTEQLARLIAL